MIIKCPCGKKLKASPMLMGKKARCPACQRMLLIPKIRPAAAPRIATTPGQGLRANLESKLNRREGDAESLGDNKKLRLPVASAQDPRDGLYPAASPQGGESTSRASEDMPSRIESLWSRSIIEESNRLCPHCQKSIPESFNQCSHCGKHLAEAHQEDDNCEGDDCRYKFKFMSTLHNLFCRGAA